MLNLNIIIFSVIFSFSPLTIWDCAAIAQNSAQEKNTTSTNFLAQGSDFEKTLLIPQDLNPTYFKWSGEYRTRYEFLSPPEGTGSSSLNTFSHRFIVSTDFAPEEDIKIKASLMLSENLAEDFKGYAGYPLSENSNNAVSVYELYANWLSESGLGFKVGRFLYSTNNENFFSSNLDDPFPTRFDGGLLLYSKDYFNFSGGGFILSQFQDPNLKIETSRLFLASVDLKLDQNLLQNINLSFVSYDTKEKTFPEFNNFIFPEQSFTMYSASLTGELGPIFYTADVAIQQGNNLTLNQLVDAKMLNGKLGYKFNKGSQLKIYGQFHRDSGDKNQTSDTFEGYNPLFYNHFLNAGRMNLLGWGNLTTYSLGLSFKSSPTTLIILEYNAFFRTSEDAGINGLTVTGTSPLTLDLLGTNSGPYDNNLNSVNTSIGDELDLIIEFKSAIGLKFQSITGLFQPGSYLKDYNKSKLIFFQRFGLEFFF